MAKLTVIRDDAILHPGHRGAGCESLRCGERTFILILIFEMFEIELRAVALAVGFIRPRAL
jgi:hypothetical protein